MLGYDEWNMKQDEWAENDVGEVALGYALKAMFWSGVDEKTIRSVIINMKCFFEIYPVDEAVSAYDKSPYKHIDFESERTNI